MRAETPTKSSSELHCLMFMYHLQSRPGKTLCQLREHVLPLLADGETWTGDDVSLVLVQVVCVRTSVSVHTYRYAGF